MILSWSPHQTAKVWWQPSQYLFFAMVDKQIGDRRENILRDPVPELLYGAPRLYQAAINQLPYKNRYRVAVMTFTKNDIDAAAFNRGDPAARQPIAACIEAFFEVVFAGVPEPSRLPVAVGTHTHAGGKLEVNIAMARGIWDASGKLYSFNPRPPTLGSKNDFRSLNDRLNQRFGWQDPGCPSLWQRLKTAHWIRKQAAESQRNFVSPAEENPFATLWIMLQDVADDLENREDLLNEMEPILDAFGLHVFQETEESISIGNSDKPTQKMVLQGALVDGRKRAGPADFEKRMNYMAGAKERLARVWKNRASWNTKHFSAGSWAETPPDFDAIFDHPNLRLSRCHPDHAPEPKPGAVNANRDPHMRSRIEDLLTAHMARLRENLIADFIYAKLFPLIIEPLAETMRTLKITLEHLNDKLTQDPRHSDIPHADQRGVDNRADRPSEERDRKQRHGTDRRADAGLDSGVEHHQPLHGKSEWDAHGVRHAGSRAARSGQQDRFPVSPDHSDRQDSVSDLCGSVRARHTGRLTVWKAIDRAARTCFPQGTVTTHMICADDPEAVAMRGADWRLRVSPDGMVVTHGTLPGDVWRHIEAEISSNFRQIGPLPENWREGWERPDAMSKDAEDFPGMG